MLAARHGRFDVVKLLVNKGADVNAIGSNNRTAINWAKLSNNWEIANYLRANGAKD